MANDPANRAQTNRVNVMPEDTPSEIANPQTNTEVFYGSFSSILMQNLGQYVVIEFLVGTNRLEIKEGILYSAGINFLSLYDPLEDRYIVCDLYSVKFVTFYNTTTVPQSRMTQYGSIPTRNTSYSGIGNAANAPSEINLSESMDYRVSEMGLNGMRGGRRMY